MNIQVRPVSYGTYQGFVPNRGEQAQIKKDLMDDSHVSYWDLVHSFAALIVTRITLKCCGHCPHAICFCNGVSQEISDYTI